MRRIIKSFCFVVFLISCGATEESRYRNTENLERPPTLVNSPSREHVVDNSSIPKKKDRKGLGSDVYLTAPLQLTLKQSFSDAWDTLRRALKQSNLKITDHERDKGLYFVSQETDNSGFFAKASSFFTKDPAIYLLTVKSEDQETTVTASLANAAEQSSVAKDGATPPNLEGAEELLQQLFKTLRDTLEEQ